MKKENAKELGKIFPSEIILSGERYFPEEFFNNECIERNIFSGEKVDLEDLYIIGTHAEGREFIGAYDSDIKLVRYNEFKTWEKSMCFRPIYDEDVILVGENWVEIAENPVVYFLLESR